MEKSEEINELSAALSKAQGVIIPASKDSDNPFFKSKYADLAAVWEVARDPLYKNGLSITQHPSAEGNAVTVETVLTHSSGQWMSSRLTMTAKDPGPQAIGSCITYARRYGLSAVVGIASEIDDDGNAATGLSKVDKKEKHSDPIIPQTLKESVLRAATTKFKSADLFKTWRVDNNLIEDIDKATPTDLSHILNLLREAK